MAIKLTDTQAEAVRQVKACNGASLAFGSGMGRFNVALRGLMHRHPELVRRTMDPDGKTERWYFTQAGDIAFLNV